MEVERRSRVGARRDHLHGRDLQERGQDDLRQGRVARRSVGALQLQSRGEHAARDRLPRGRAGRRGGAEGSCARGCRAERLQSETLNPWHGSRRYWDVPGAVLLGGRLGASEPWTRNARSTSTWSSLPSGSITCTTYPPPPAPRVTRSIVPGYFASAAAAALAASGPVRSGPPKPCGGGLG